jgi:hypothetical protein
MEAPVYPCNSIYSVRALALALGESEQLLIRLAARCNRMYRYVPQTKKNGDKRDTYDAHHPLKRVQRKIVDRILSRVVFPSYLHGGIKDRLSPRSIYSNAKVHSGARFVILQDIKDFYPSISSTHVTGIYKDIFRFGDAVAQLLSALCTRNGCPPQGASTSGYLANLVFWNNEPKIVQSLLEAGYHYTRFADDITITCSHKPSAQDIKEVIASTTGMLAAKGCYQKRTKMHVRVKGQTVNNGVGEVSPLTVTGLSIVNDGPAIAKAERRRIRSAVKEVESLSASSPCWPPVEPAYRRAMGRVGRLLACGHPDGQTLKARLNAAKALHHTALLTRYVSTIDTVQCEVD